MTKKCSFISSGVKFPTAWCAIPHSVTCPCVYLRPRSSQHLKIIFVIRQILFTTRKNFQSLIHTTRIYILKALQLYFRERINIWSSCYFQTDIKLFASGDGHWHWHRSGDWGGKVVDLGLINHSHGIVDLLLLVHHGAVLFNACHGTDLRYLLYLVSRDLVLIWELGLVWHSLGHVTDRCIVRHVVHVVSHLASIVQLILITANSWVDLLLLTVQIVLIAYKI